MTTTLGSYERLKDGFEKDEMPLAFQEAAVIAQYLDIDYIWIDSLCIVQDNEDDWESQAAHMGQIFESAAVTIAASLSHNPHESLFVRKNPRYEEFELYNDSHGNYNGAVFKARRKTTFGIHAKTGRSKDVDHLDTRAWGLQEKLLSRRLIAFTGAEIQWTCRTSKVCECRSKTYTPEPLLLPSAKEADIKNEHGYAKAWSRIVEPYSDRSLTFPDDRLPAISGLAKKFQQTTDFTYIAGLWKENICYDLMWQCDIMTSALLSTPMVDSAASTIGLNPFGKVTDGSLDVRGTTIEAWLRSSSGTPDDYELCIMDTIYQPNADQRKACEFSIDLQHTAGIWANTGEQPAQALGSKRLRIGIGDIETPVVLLGVYSIHHRNYLYQNFLILRSSPRAINTYERLGIGSGKIYNRDEIPAQSQLVQPFEWLSVDLGERAHALKTVVDQVIRIT
ncbi:HET-domain-containing protein [Curvularia clavata]|uniref:HET-domain-containing protein n=1 Tax=Curvularia clavata TaxID=95742 RepID=A0A9Q8Z8B5_CURCL|nr:HET-domain-containing protein [Curvularia clavata]